MFAVVPCLPQRRLELFKHPGGLPGAGQFGCEAGEPDRGIGEGLHSLPDRSRFVRAGLEGEHLHACGGLLGDFVRLVSFVEPLGGRVERQFFEGLAFRRQIGGSGGGRGLGAFAAGLPRVGEVVFERDTVDGGLRDPELGRKVALGWDGVALDRRGDRVALLAGQWWAWHTSIVRPACYRLSPRKGQRRLRGPLRGGSDFQPFDQRFTQPRCPKRACAHRHWARDLNLRRPGMPSTVEQPFDHRQVTTGAAIRHGRGLRHS